MYIKSILYRLWPSYLRISTTQISIRRRYFDLTGLFSVLLVLSTMGGCSKKANKTSTVSKSNAPNIVLIFMDDMGYGDVGPYGSIDYNTPHIDRLAAQGMRFTNMYAQPICSASRAALLTGSQPPRVGVTMALFPHSNIGLNPKEETIADILKKRGYATGMVGKWHLGDAKKFLPLQQGFDMFLGLPYSHDMWPKGYRNTPINKIRSEMPPLPLIDGNKTVQYISNFEQMDRLNKHYTERAVQFINQHKDQPFFLYFAHNLVHTPLFASKQFQGKSKQGLYGDAVEAVDWSTGQIMKTLKENGLDDNTLVIFTSDNGPWLKFGNRSGSAGGLREGKATTFDGGMKEPSIFRWPSVIPSGTVNNNLASTMDILPTLAKITGAQLPQHKIDGVNILPLLNSPKNESPRKHLFYYYHKDALEAVREGHWKLILPHKYNSYKNEQPGQNGSPGSTHQDSTGIALYNLRRDPGERYDVQKSYPEVVKRLMKLVDQERNELGDSNVGVECSQCRSSGKVNDKAVYPTLNPPTGKLSKPMNWSKIISDYIKSQKSK